MVSVGAAAFLTSARGVSDPTALAAVAAAIVALVLFKVSSLGAPVRPQSTAPSPRSPSVKEEATELAGNLEALAAARSYRNAEALESRNTVAVYLSSTGQNQIAVIKALRKQFNLDLKAAKDLSDAAKHGQKPSLDQAMPSSAARAFEREIKRAGGELEIR
jgi:ribosomal protein L7/L12